MKFTFKPINADNVIKRKHDLRKIVNDCVLKTKDHIGINRRLSSIKDLFDLPEKSEQFRLITQKAFTSTDFIKWISEKESIIELNIAVYRMNQKNVALLKLIHQAGNFPMNVVLSSFFKTSKKAEVWHDNLAEYISKDKKSKLCYCVNHAKVMCIKTNENYYVIEGSGNMSSNARIEQYVLDNSKSVYDFHSKWIKDLCNGL